MTSVSLQVDIPVEPERVYDALTDPSRFDEWQPLHESWPHGIPEIEQGRSFVQRTRFMGRSNDITWTVVELRPPTTIVLDGHGPMGIAMRSSYRLSGGQSHTDLQLETRIDGAPATMRVMARRGGRAMAAASLAELTALLIGDEPAPVPDSGRRLPAVPGLAAVLGVVADGARLVTPRPVRRAVRALARRP